MKAAQSATLVSLPAGVLLSLWLGGAVMGQGAWTVDFSRTNGVIRPLHGVNLGPLCYRGMVDLTDYHRALDLPLNRFELVRSGVAKEGDELGLPELEAPSVVLVRLSAATDSRSER